MTNIFASEKYTIIMKIVFCGGGTAGHITPNIALIDKLASEECFYIGTNGMEKQLTEPLLQNRKLQGFFEISAAKFRRKPTPKNLTLPFALAKSIRQSKKILKEIRPDLVFSKGGYVGLPVAISAKMLKIPIVIHESDRTMGLANKISAMFADEVFTTYPQEGKHCSKKIKTVGAIVREEILQGNKQKGLETIGFDAGKPILLVTGGSLGAKSLNNAVCANAETLSRKFDIFVICGKNKKLNCNFVHQAEFVQNIADVFAATDLCLTRAGSNALAELTLANVPFVAVPLEKCSRGEQIKNARWFAKNGCGLCLEEFNLEKTLTSALFAAYDNRETIVRKQKQHSDLFGTDILVDQILKYGIHSSNKADKTEKSSSF